MGSTLKSLGLVLAVIGFAPFVIMVFQLGLHMAFDMNPKPFMDPVKSVGFAFALGIPAAILTNVGMVMEMNEKKDGNG